MFVDGAGRLRLTRDEVREMVVYELTLADGGPPRSRSKAVVVPQTPAPLPLERYLRGLERSTARPKMARPGQIRRKR